MSDTFMEKLTALRQDWGQAMVVSSAYRCVNHPIEARKDKPGAHASGHAVDILITGEDAYKFLCAALGHGFTGIGINQTGNWGSRFIHLDDLQSGDGFPRPTLWSY
jgi:uncharacterized protein YcbK (DUF882 family)